jgi:hypothetical protein
MDHDLFRVRAVTSSVNDRAGTPPQPSTAPCNRRTKNLKASQTVKRIAIQLSGCKSLTLRTAILATTPPAGPARIQRKRSTGPAGCCPAFTFAGPSRIHRPAPPVRRPGNLHRVSRRTPALGRTRSSVSRGPPSPGRAWVSTHSLCISADDGQRAAAGGLPGRARAGERLSARLPKKPSTLGPSATASRTSATSSSGSLPGTAGHSSFWAGSRYHTRLGDFRRGMKGV